MVTPAIPPGATPVAADLGAYAEDHEFVEGSGHLDVHNGRFAVTPEYPEGTYAYCATVDADWNPAYPYFIASFRGVVAEDNFAAPGPLGSGGPMTEVVIGEPVETWNGASGVSERAALPWGCYPNPATDRLHWLGEVPAVLDVWDAQGRRVRTVATSGAVDCGGWPNGLYLIGQPGVGFLRITVQH